MLVVDDHTLLTAGLVCAQVLVDAPVAAPATLHATMAPRGEGVVGSVIQWAQQSSNVLVERRSTWKYIGAMEEGAEEGKG